MRKSFSTRLIPLLAAVLLPAAASATVSVLVTESGVGIVSDSAAVRAQADTVQAGAAGAGSWRYQAGGSAELGRGTLGVFVNHDTIGLEHGEAPAVRAMAQLFDTVTFHGGGPTADVTLSWNVLGSFNAQVDGSSFSTRAQIRLDGRTSAMELVWTAPQLVGIFPLPFSNPRPRIDVQNELPGALHVTMHADFTVPTGVALPLSGLLFTEVRPQGTEHAISNFAHTATLVIGLPAGVTVSSGSGVLLAVPEPPAAMLALAGLLLMGALGPWRISAARSRTAHRACRAPARH